MALCKRHSPQWVSELPGKVTGIVLGADGAIYAAFSCLTEVEKHPPFKINKVGGAAGIRALDVRTGKKVWESDMEGSLIYCALKCVANDGTAILECSEDLGGGPDRVVAKWTKSGGSAKSPWPMAHQNSQRSGMSPEAAAKYLAQIPVVEEQERRAAAVSYTHLTLPTNREV